MARGQRCIQADRRDMRVLLVHNQYNQRGGEDAVADSEQELLLRHGHQVRRLHRHNRDLANMHPASAAVQALYSLPTRKAAAQVLADFAPDVVHVHNTFPLISPSVYWACADAGVPVVQTLHNFRVACPQAMFLREGNVCEDCLGRAPWPAIRHGCYRGSRAETTVLSSMLVLHRQLGTWTDKVSLYIALNEFCRRKFVQAGLPEHRLVVKPNFVDVPAPVLQARSGMLFVGRLSEEKGVAVLGQAQRQAGTEVALDVIGDGPMRGHLEDLSGVQLLGAMPQQEVLQRMSAARALVLPSICYESFPRTLVEAFACGLPVLASRIGALAELVTDGITGLHFEAGNPADLASKMAWAHAHPEEMARMGLRARAEYEERYTPAQNHALLIDIYLQAIERQPPGNRHVSAPARA